jgi:hypothetical protein
MNEIEKLKAEIARDLPEATATIDAPDDARGSWWLDVEHGGRRIAIEWRPRNGFGVSSGSGGYGEGPDEVLRTREAAREHVENLLRSPRKRKAS